MTKIRFIKLRAQGLSLKKISKKLDVDIPCLKIWDEQLKGPIEKQKVREVMQDLAKGTRSRFASTNRCKTKQATQDSAKDTLSCLAGDVEYCDRLCKLLREEIEERGVANLSTVDLFRYHSDVLKVKNLQLQMTSKINSKKGAII